MSSTLNSPTIVETTTVSVNEPTVNVIVIVTSWIPDVGNVNLPVATSNKSG